MNKPSLMIVDDEKDVLSALQRLLRKEFRLFLFDEPLKALAFYKETPIPLVLSDMRMPEMDGASLLGEIARIYPKSQRIILTGHADLEMTVAAVNQGHISHYFHKPWDNQELVNTLKNAFIEYQKQLLPIKLLKQNQHKNSQLLQKNDSLLKVVQDKQLKLNQNQSKSQENQSNFIRIYANLICLHTQDATGHNYRIASQAQHIAQQLDCDQQTLEQIHLAALLYETGKLAIPQTLLMNCYDNLNKQQQTSYNQFYQLAEEIMQPVKDMQKIAKIIKHIPESYDGSGMPDHLVGEDIPLASRLIAILVAFDNLLLARKTPLSNSFEEAKKLIEGQTNSLYDPQLMVHISALMNRLPSSETSPIEYLINAVQLRIGMRTTQDIHNAHQAVLLTKDTMITQAHIDRLKRLEKSQQEVLLIFVHTLEEMPS